jgi:hypothetical protein
MQGPTPGMQPPVGTSNAVGARATATPLENPEHTTAIVRFHVMLVLPHDCSQRYRRNAIARVVDAQLFVHFRRVRGVSVYQCVVYQCVVYQWCISVSVLSSRQSLH